MVRRSIRLTQCILAAATVLCVPLAHAAEEEQLMAVAQQLNLDASTLDSGLSLACESFQRRMLSNVCKESYKKILGAERESQGKGASDKELKELQFELMATSQHFKNCYLELATEKQKVSVKNDTGKSKLAMANSALAKLNSKSLLGTDPAAVIQDGRKNLGSAKEDLKGCADGALNVQRLLWSVRVQDSCLAMPSGNFPASANMGLSIVRNWTRSFSQMRGELTNLQNQSESLQTQCLSDVQDSAKLDVGFNSLSAANAAGTKPQVVADSEQSVASADANAPTESVTAEQNAQTTSLPTGGSFSNAPRISSRGAGIGGMGEQATGMASGLAGLGMMALASKPQSSGGGGEKPKSATAPAAADSKKDSAAEIAAQAAKDKMEADAFLASLTPKTQLNTVSVGTDAATVKLNSSANGGVPTTSGRTTDGVASSGGAPLNSGHAGPDASTTNPSVVASENQTVGAGRALAAASAKSSVAKCTSKDKNSELCRIQAKRINDKKTEVYADPLLQSGVNQ